MNQRRYNRLFILVISIFVVVMGILCQLKSPDAFSLWERRKLAQKPSFSVASVKNGSYMTQMETAVNDQFPFRNEFRQIKSFVSYYILGNQDVHNIAMVEGSAVALSPSLNTDSVMHACQVFQKTYQQYLEPVTGNVYYSIIPDKSYYLPEDSCYPQMDYRQLFALMEEQMDFATEVPISSYFSLEDYYRTDSHLKQTALTEASTALTDAMASTAVLDSYTTETATTQFYGVYYGQAALPMAPDTISYLTNKTIEQASVYHYETKLSTGIYDPSKLDSKDSYEFFLSGADPLLRITNDNAASNRSLILFRDSFGSSFAPLFLNNYSEILVIDLRYIKSDYLANYVDFANYRNADVLFLYSTSLLNASSTLQ